MVVLVAVIASQLDRQARGQLRVVLNNVAVLVLPHLAHRDIKQFTFWAGAVVGIGNS